MGWQNTPVFLQRKTQTLYSHVQLNDRLPVLQAARELTEKHAATISEQLDVR